ncbi:replicative superfamily II helicase [Rhizobium binae]|uniref:Replicative superfamily II helicase n=1 Tax=Rhizobium binae TaxID=1138190 RepID=A0ABV2MFR6_9HYPH|nr:DEAD/DEAH box helicase [Rhizobium binae]MBX4993157.1 DEAD/DEAH box helicase [Rhizobium binae]NKL47460.1 DEAD/DEAH box helicase [Rhizobium leguminosarum bv. viciae]QSY83921.1 DEAD/DEAH box helicase [Rhizobium binae]
MAFRGLFVGVDRYQSPDIGDLSCAARDATALDALFSDTLGGPTVLLADQDATLSRIEFELDKLTQCDAEDTVVIAFSGHGSQTHELIVHDTDYYDIEATSLPLDRLQEWFSKIPARRVILFLDCCFSGGLGAKVLQVPAIPRSMASTEARLQKLAGNGRLILTASAASEEAWEFSSHGHGLLTYYLLEALRGPAEIVQAGRLSVYQVLEYVTGRVKAAAHQIGKSQNPAMRGQIDGLNWPVFAEGARYLAAFPSARPAAVTEDVASLASYGFPDEIVTAWGQAIPSFNALQVEAINDYGILDGKHLLVSAPTSSGKTMVGELAALRQVVDRKRAIFLLPLKALVADKRRHFEKVYGGFGLRVLEATGETDDVSPLIRGKYDIALLTYEKFAALALAYPHILAQAGTIVVDEVQMIADQSRGANLEFILTLIRMRRREGIEPQIIALSAVIGDTGGLETWLGGRLLRRTERPVPLREGVLRYDGSFRYLDPSDGTEKIERGVVVRMGLKETAQDWIIPLLRKLTTNGEHVIVFRESKSESRNVGNYLAAQLGLPPADEALRRMPRLDPSQAHRDLIADLQHGVAFHNADLQAAERQVIEEEFRREGSGLQVISATTTLAMGVNTPANSVIIVGLEHPGPVPVPYSVAEYKNLVGRAGRLGYADQGTSYLMAINAREEDYLWRRYVVGKPEDLSSRFVSSGTDPRSLVVRVLVALPRSAASGVARDDIVSFLESSFGAYLAGRQQDGWRWSHDDLVRALSNLEANGLIQKNSEGLYSLVPLGRLAGESATEVGSIVRLVDALSHLPPSQITEPVLLTVVQNTVELDEVNFPINRKSIHKEPHTWPSMLGQQQVPWDVIRRLNSEAIDQHSATLRAKKAMATLLYVSGLSMSEIEVTMGQHGGAFGGSAGPIRSVSSRTADLIGVAARVAEILYPELDLAERIQRLAVRLTYGVPGAAADLAREAGATLTRGDYCALVEAGLADTAKIVTADDGDILRLLGDDKEKVAVVRGAARSAEERKSKAAAAPLPVIPQFVA